MALNLDCTQLIDKIVYQLSSSSMVEESQEDKLREAFGTMIRAFDKSVIRSTIITNIDAYFTYFQESMRKSQRADSSDRSSEFIQRIRGGSLMLSSPEGVKELFKSKASPPLGDVFGAYLANRSFDASLLAKILIGQRDVFNQGQLQHIVRIFYLRLATHPEWISTSPIATSCLLGLLINTSALDSSLWKYCIQFPTIQYWTIGFALFWNHLKDLCYSNNNFVHQSILEPLIALERISFPESLSVEKRDLLKIKVPVWILFCRWMREKDSQIATRVAKSLHSMIFCEGSDPREFIQFFVFEHFDTKTLTDEEIFLDWIYRTEVIHLENLMAFMKHSLLLESQTEIEAEVGTSEIDLLNVDYEVDVTKSIVDLMDEHIKENPQSNSNAKPQNLQTKRRKVE